MLLSATLAAFAQSGQQVSPGPLSKAHAALEGPGTCRSCHAADGKVTPDLCLTCHQDVGDRIRVKKGVHRAVAGACSDCHVEHGGADADLRPFDPADFDHAGETGFALKGRHATVAKNCASCHTSRSFLTVSPSCATCHTDPHAARRGAACETCHTPEGWASASRAFHKTGRFNLEGRHLDVPCESCHIKGAVKGTPTKCVDCHWVRRQDDPYRTRLGSDCETCHRPVSWTAVTWSHGAATGTPLSPAHRALGCDSCHTNRRFDAGSPSCHSCHAKQYQSTTQPAHLAAGFPTQCELCHKPSHTSFTQASFQHNAYFPLSGVHATQACASCHRNSVYKGTPRDCVGCHQADYERTASPSHAAAGFPTACESCHRPSDASWKTTFNHSSAYPLAGVHATQPCTVCHTNNVYKGTPRDCFSCHRTNYERTTSPNHAAAGFPTACESCHRVSDASWRATFNHNAVFALVGVHATQACAACHTNNVFKGTPRDCFSCHRTDYERTTSPNHPAAGFPTACDSCHSASSSTWSASFDHNRFFVLAGRHLSAACSSCHRNSVYRGTPRECYPCHQTQYDRTTDPNHRAAGFPTTCETCHRYTDASFSQGRFNHTWFPITSGKHAGRACAECHLDPNNYKVFSCTTCHTRAKMDAEHAGRAGYRYDSAACYSCHPTGQG
ncbi:MAG: cytochrome c3 family protein [Vicinamibacterales bacterium]